MARYFVLVLCAGLMTMARAGRVYADSPSVYSVLIRQMDGRESIPAHMTCREGKVCLGEMSVSVEGSHRRIFVRGMINGSYAYFKFRSDAGVQRCTPEEFVVFKLEAAPASTHREEGLCDPPSSTSDEASGLRHPVLKTFPAFAFLRIDVRSR
jgi:hypothetical protein